MEELSEELEDAKRKRSTAEETLKTSREELNAARKAVTEANLAQSVLADCFTLLEEPKSEEMTM